MDEWKVSIEVWAYSTGESSEEMAKKCGGKFRNWHVYAEDMKDALRLTELYCKGIQTNPAVWQTRINKIERL